MTLEMLRSFLLYCTLINYGILIVWLIAITSARDWILSLHSRWFRLSREQFDVIHYSAMAVYKLGILLFNLTPLLALWLIA